MHPFMDKTAFNGVLIIAKFSCTKHPPTTMVAVDIVIE